MSKATPYGLDIAFLLLSALPSPKLMATSEIDWVIASTAIGSLKLNVWFWASTRPWSMNIRASPTIPDIAQAQCWSSSTSFSLRADGTINFEDCIFFSTPRITPWFVLTPIAVEPNYYKVQSNHCLSRFTAYHLLFLAFIQSKKWSCAKFNQKFDNKDSISMLNSTFLSDFAIVALTLIALIAYSIW